MDWKRILGQLDKWDFNKVDEFIDRILVLATFVFVLAAFIFGAWVTWSIAGEMDIETFTQVGYSFVGGCVSGAVMWVVWFFVKLLH